MLDVDKALLEEARRPGPQLASLVERLALALQAACDREDALAKGRPVVVVVQNGPTSKTLSAIEAALRGDRPEATAEVARMLAGNVTASLDRPVVRGGRRGR